MDREKLKEIVLEIRQYLCNTEFAPEPFREPIDPDKLTIEFPQKIQDIFDEETPTCGLCGGKLSNNPHPDAGKPIQYIEVGTRYVCIPCTTKSRHKWAERAMEAEGQIKRLFKEIEELKGWGYSNEPCFHITNKNWQSLKDKYGGV